MRAKDITAFKFHKQDCGTVLKYGSKHVHSKTVGGPSPARHRTPRVNGMFDFSVLVVAGRDRTRSSCWSNPLSTNPFSTSYANWFVVEFVVPSIYRGVQQLPEAVDEEAPADPYGRLMRLYYVRKFMSNTM